MGPLLFIIVPDALSKECRSSLLWEMYAVGLVLIAESLEELWSQV